MTVVNAIACQTIANLVARGIEPPIYISANMPGGDEHNARLLAENAERSHYLEAIDNQSEPAFAPAASRSSLERDTLPPGAIGGLSDFDLRGPPLNGECPSHHILCTSCGRIRSDDDHHRAACGVVEGLSDAE